MFINSMLSQNRILGAGMNAAMIRNEVISNNIANADVMNFRRSVVEFEPFLARAVDNFRRTGNLDLTRTSPRVRQVNDGFTYRVDGNNVDPLAQQAELYQNSLRYDVLSNSLMSNYRRINAALSAR